MNSSEIRSTMYPFPIALKSIYIFGYFFFIVPFEVKETFENPVNSIKLSNCFFEKFLIFFSGPKPYALTKDPTVGSKKP